MEVYGEKGGLEGLLADKTLRKGVFAVMLSRYVCKKGRETVEPARVFRAAGLLVDDDGEGEEDGLVDGEKVDAAVKNGLKYVGECMLILFGLTSWMELAQQPLVLLVSLKPLSGFLVQPSRTSPLGTKKDLCRDRKTDRAKRSGPSDLVEPLFLH
ncbi:hypothetical protein VTK26DRAFT_4437 [Humicola hyalothermophila]